MEASRRQQIAAEHRAHKKNLETLQSEYAPSRDINDEFMKHQARIAAILGEDNTSCVGTQNGPTS